MVKKTPPQLIYRGEKGRRAGESHPNARLTDTDIDLMREMHELVDDHGRTLYGYRKLARVFECSRGYARYVVKGNRR